jgi:hypothetical protein
MSPPGYLKSKWHAINIFLIYQAVKVNTNIYTATKVDKVYALKLTKWEIKTIFQEKKVAT